MSLIDVTIADEFDQQYLPTPYAPQQPNGLDRRWIYDEKTLTLVGAASSLSFLGLLLIPGAPGQLAAPSWIALLIWSALGAILFIARRKHIQDVPKQVLDHLILADTEEPVEPLVAGRLEPRLP